MITTEGSRRIKRYLASLEPRIAGALVFGVGTSTPTLGDTSLDFEIGYGDIYLTSYDFDTDEIIFKARVPTSLIGKINEVGLVSHSSDVLMKRDDFVIAAFDEENEAWETSPGVPADFVTSNIRVGNYGLSLTPATSLTESATLATGLNLENNSDSDQIVFAAHCSSNVESISILLMTDDSNYYQFTTSTPSAGYGIFEITRGAMAVTGSPSWANITSVRVSATATSGGAATVVMDAIRITDNDMISSGHILVARTVLGAEFDATIQNSKEIEFALSVTVP